MALRINHNVPALNALRNLNRTDQDMSQSLERLSSGQKVNRAADGPASLVISEQMRGQISSINQAIKNSEASISMVQTAEAALDEVNRLLISLRQLAIHAANEGANDQKMLAADQAEISNALDTIDRIARTSQFGTRTLLDGSNGANGIAVGEGLEFVSASPTTRSSPAEGYKVDITKSATRPFKAGERPIRIEDLKPTDLKQMVRAFNVMIAEGGKNIAFSMDNPDDSKSIRGMIENFEKHPEVYNRADVEKSIREIIAQKLQQKADAAGLRVDVFIVDDTNGEWASDVTGARESSARNLTRGSLLVVHKDYGSKPTFHVSGNTEKVLAEKANTIEEGVRGRDVQGKIAEKIGRGIGEVLLAPDNTDPEGLQVRFSSARMLELRHPRKKLDGLGRLADNTDIVKPDGTIRDLKEMEAPALNARAVSRKEDGEFIVDAWEVPANVSKDVEGFVHVTQNSLAFQVGPTRGQQVKISLVDAKTDRLATNVANKSGFHALREVDVTTPQGAQDALALVDNAITEIAQVRANLGAFQKNTLQSNTNSLRIAEENLTSAESSLRDADMAEEMSKFTRNQIMLASGIAMLAQANQTPQTVMTLLANRNS